MSKRVVSILRRVFNDRRGQALPWIAAGMFGFVGMAGLTVDVGRTYVLYNQLRSSTQAAALAAASGIYDTPGTAGSAANRAIQFSSGSSDYNSHPSLTLSGPPTVNLVCLNSLMPKGTKCLATNPTPNAVKVTQAATAPTYFAKIFGFNSIPMSVTATAAPNQTSPWNVAIILDSTGSMATTDSNCGGVTRFQCALYGIKSLLATTNPCLGASCTDTDAVVRIGLFAFPNISSATVPYASNCDGTLKADLYTFPLENATSYTPLQYQGQVVRISGQQVTRWSAFQATTTNPQPQTDSIPTLLL